MVMNVKYFTENHINKKLGLFGFLKLCEWYNWTDFLISKCLLCWKSQGFSLPIAIKLPNSRRVTSSIKSYWYGKLKSLAQSSVIHLLPEENLLHGGHWGSEAGNAQLLSVHLQLSKQQFEPVRKHKQRAGGNRITQYLNSPKQSILTY